MSKSVLVIGGGFSGITAALEAAEVGYEVFLVEKEPYLGGRVAQLNQYFPKLCPPSCGLEIQFQRLKRFKNVHILTMAEVTSLTGGPGSYQATIKIRPRFVNENCTCCGACAEAAKTTVPRDFDFGLSSQKAAYLPVTFAFPMRYVIEGGKVTAAELDEMAEACNYDAVVVDDKEKELTIDAGAVVWATGWRPYDMAKLTNLGAGLLDNVISNMQMERLAAPNGPTEGRIVRPSDHKDVANVAFVQCAGSRDENHLPFCSYICCMASLKQAAYVRERYPDALVTIYYIDLRTPGRYEKFLARIREDDKVRFVKGKEIGRAHV